MFITTTFLVLLNVIAWLPAFVVQPLLRSPFKGVLTIGASPALLLLDAAPERQPPTLSYSAFPGIAGPVFVFLAGLGWLIPYVARWSPHLEILQYRFSLWISTIERHPFFDHAHATSAISLDLSPGGGVGENPDKSETGKDKSDDETMAKKNEHDAGSVPSAVLGSSGQSPSGPSSPALSRSSSLIACPSPSGTDPAPLEVPRRIGKRERLRAGASHFCHRLEGHMRPSHVQDKMQAILRHEGGLQTIERAPSIKGSRRRALKALVKSMETP